ncbi:hypothetical protein OIO90_001390 [Microbotryomycetes sp. JL221]|nr:hypothetical protein OIO90_001390 [Microbotryomycetes sp. JL221]
MDVPPSLPSPSSPSTINMASSLRRSVAAGRRDTLQLSSEPAQQLQQLTQQPHLSIASTTNTTSLGEAFAPQASLTAGPNNVRDARSRSPTPASSHYESANEATPRQAQFDRVPHSPSNFRQALSGNIPHSPLTAQHSESTAGLSVIRNSRPMEIAATNRSLAESSPPLHSSNGDHDDEDDDVESSDSQDWKGVDLPESTSPLKSPLLSLLAGEHEHMQSFGTVTSDDSTTMEVEHLRTSDAKHDDNDAATSRASDEASAQSLAKALNAVTLQDDEPWRKPSSYITSPNIPNEDNASNLSASLETAAVAGTSPSQVGKALDWDDKQPSRPSTPQPSTYVPGRPSLGTPPHGSRQSSRQSSPVRSPVRSPSLTTTGDRANSSSSPLASQQHAAELGSPADVASSQRAIKQSDVGQRSGSRSNAPATLESASVTTAPRRPARRELPPPPEKSSKRTSLMRVKKQQPEDQASTATASDDVASEGAGHQRRPSLASPSAKPGPASEVRASPRIPDTVDESSAKGDDTTHRLSLYSFADSDSRHGLTQPNTPLSASDFAETYGGQDFGQTSSVEGSIAASRPSSFYNRASAVHDPFLSGQDMVAASRTELSATYASPPARVLAGTSSDVPSAMLSFGISESADSLQSGASRAQTPSSYQDSFAGNNRLSSEVSDDVFHDAPMARIGSSTEPHYVVTTAVSENSRATTPLPFSSNKLSPSVPPERTESPRGDAKARAAAFVADLKKAAGSDAAFDPLTSSSSSFRSSQPTPPSVYVPAAASPYPSSLHENGNRAPVDTNLSDASSSTSSQKQSPLPPPPASALPPSPLSSAVAQDTSLAIRSPPVQVTSPALSQHGGRTLTSDLTANAHGLAPRETLSPGYNRLHRRRALPVALQIAPDLRRVHTAGERANVYFGKVRALKNENSGLQSWITFVKASSMTPIADGGLQGRRARQESSSSTFPSRGDGYRAREISGGGGSFSPRDSLASLPYPGVTSKSKAAAKTALFGLGRKASKRAGGPLISGPVVHAATGASSVSSNGRPAIGPPTNLTTSMSLSSLSTISTNSTTTGSNSRTTISGPRMPRQNLDFGSGPSSAASILSPSSYAVGGPAASLSSTTLVGSGGSVGSQGSTEYASRSLSSSNNLTPMRTAAAQSSYSYGIDEDKLERLNNILPTASREGLIAALTKAGGDEVLAVSVYLSDETTRR